MRKKSARSKERLVFIRPYGIYTVKDVRLDDVYLYGGVDADKTFYQTTISIKKSNYLKLESTDIVKKYFKGLLDPRKSYWHVNAIDESIY